jgi:hypothetical protein
VRRELFDRHLRDDSEIEALHDVHGLAVDRVDDRRAGRTPGLERKAGLARDEHEVVEEQRVLPVREELRETHRAAAALVEDVVGRHLAAERELPPLLGNGLGVAAQRQLLAQERVTGRPVFVGLVREADAVDRPARLRCRHANLLCRARRARARRG